MYLRTNLIKKSGRTYLTIMQGFRNENGQPRSRVVKSLGYLDELEKQYPDPIAHFKKIAEEEKYDGYYVIVTSELDEADEKIIDTYHGLWQIEEFFKITKSTLDARPVYVRNIEHINAHFLICFIALLILRLIELKMDNRFRAARIVQTLRQIECTHIDQNYYLFHYYDEVAELMEKVFRVDLSKKILSLGEIKKNLASVKK